MAIVVLFETVKGKITKIFPNQKIAEHFIVEHEDKIKSIKVLKELSIPGGIKDPKTMIPAVELWEIIGRHNTGLVVAYDRTKKEFTAQEVARILAKDPKTVKSEINDSMLKMMEPFLPRGLTRPNIQASFGKRPA